MQVKLADEYGFCYGVKNSIAMAEANPGSVIVGGEIIHNPDEPARLKRDFNVGIEPDPDNILPCQIAIIRAHGIAEATEKALRDRGVKLFDATCPNVKRIQDMVKKLSGKGYDIILSGDKSHPEVQGIMGYVADSSKIIVAKGSEELASIRLSGKVAVLSQTTKDIKNFLDLANWVSSQMNESVGECLLCNTICSATAKKQQAAERLAKETDVFVVVGGKNSSNTKSLAAIASKYCDTHFVERAEEVEGEWLNGKALCGLTLGSSTLDYAIQAVRQKIENFR